jgi:hypothetical protein
MNIITSALAFSRFVPSITKLICGDKAESIASKIVDVAKQISNSRTESEALKKISNDSQLLNAFQNAIIESEKEMFLAVLRDKESARSRDIAIINSGRRNKRADIMVVAAACGLIICLAVIGLYQNSLPGEAVGIISTIAGIFGSCLKDAYNFEFGSSRGSKEKDQTVATMLNKL